MQLNATYRDRTYTTFTAASANKIDRGRKTRFDNSLYIHDGSYFCLLTAFLNHNSPTPSYHWEHGRPGLACDPDPSDRNN